jgi:agmatine/peptidylarginine deiminase
MATTTNYGFEIPDDTDLVKDGALAMRDLGQDVDTQLFTALGGDYPGLRLIKTQTIGTSVSSVSITNAFSATYDSYKIIIEGGSMTSDGDLSLNLTGQRLLMLMD